MGAIEGMPEAGLLTRVLPVGGHGHERLDVRSAEGGEQLASWYAAPSRWWRMNMIGTLNARVTGADGTSDTLSNRVDRTILQHLRRTSDAVLVGAETVRNERHAPVSGRTMLAVATTSGDLAGHRISEAEQTDGVIVLCPREATERARATMPGARLEHPPLDAAGRIEVARLRGFLDELGLERVVVEGGASLIGQALDAELLDEVCLTQAPCFGPDDAPGLPGTERAAAWHRTMLAVDERGFLYARLQRATT